MRIGIGRNRDPEGDLTFLGRGSLRRYRANGCFHFRVGGLMHDLERAAE
jgi:hypothetical protein